jgi:hypothetical protein
MSYCATPDVETLVDLRDLAAAPGKSGDMTRLNEYLKTAEAVRILGVSQNTLRAWAESGKVPVPRNPANGYRLFLRHDLERFLASLARSIKD